MASAVVGLVGVLIGVVLSQVFTLSRESRTRRLDAMVAVVAASGRVIGAHERIFELFEAGTSPPVSDARVERAFSERSEAHADWRAARGQVEILLADDLALYALVHEFDRRRSEATKWIQTYLRQGEAFKLSDYMDAQKETWIGMRDARRDLIAAARRRAAADLRWPIRHRAYAVLPQTPELPE